MKNRQDRVELARLLLSEWTRVYGPLTPVLARAKAMAISAPEAPGRPGVADPGSCRRCERRQASGHVPAGFGRLDSPPIMFIGSAPDREADRSGDIYAGESGELLTRMIEKGLGFSRGQVFYTNLVKCWAPGGKEPGKEEIQSCLPHLMSQIETIKPKVIVCLGRIAACTLLETEQPILFLRVKNYTLKGRPLIASHHPATLLRRPELKAESWADLKKAMGLAGISISGRNE